jgi:hypothetical protein
MNSSRYAAPEPSRSTPLSHRRRAAGEQARRPPPLRTPGNRSRLVLCRSRGEYGCVWTTHVRRTDAPDGPLGSTRITQDELAARNRRARFPAARCRGVLRIASAADPARPLPGAIAPHQRKSQSGRGGFKTVAGRGRSGVPPFDAAQGGGEPSRTATGRTRTVVGYGGPEFPVTDPVGCGGSRSNAILSTSAR